MHPAVPRPSNHNPSGVDLSSVFERHLTDLIPNFLEALEFVLLLKPSPGGEDLANRRALGRGAGYSNVRSGPGPSHSSIIPSSPLSAR